MTLHNKSQENERRAYPQSGTLTGSSFGALCLCHLLEKAILVTLFKFIVCYLFFVLFIWEMDCRTKKSVQVLLTFSTLFLLPDENKYGCLNVLAVTHLSEQDKHRMWKQKLSQHIRQVRQPADRDWELETWLCARSHFWATCSMCRAGTAAPHSFTANVLSCVWQQRNLCLLLFDLPDFVIANFA